jgi:hypothetical protein
VHEVQDSNPGLMHILSKCFVRAYTRIYRHIPTYTFIYLLILSKIIVIPGTYKDVTVYDGSSQYMMGVHVI